MYQAARGWGVQPSEFWGMTLGEWFAEAEMAIEQADRLPHRPGSKLSRADIRNIQADMELTDEEWMAKHGR